MGKGNQKIRAGKKEKAKRAVKKKRAVPCHNPFINFFNIIYSTREKAGSTLFQENARTMAINEISKSLKISRYMVFLLHPRVCFGNPGLMIIPLKRAMLFIDSSNFYHCLKQNNTLGIFSYKSFYNELSKGFQYFPSVFL